jgi:DNA mismatch endonuclease, patch repair protein
MRRPKQADCRRMSTRARRPPEKDVRNLSIRSRAPLASAQHVRHVMQSVARVDTSPELRLRQALHALGFRYRKDTRPVRSLRCKADIVFSRAKVCVFVDGCFWHGCPQHQRTPSSNSAWWEEKLADNAARDIRQSLALKKEGWLVLRYWEHDLLNPDSVNRVAADIGRAINLRHP